MIDKKKLKPGVQFVVDKKQYVNSKVDPELDEAVANNKVLTVQEITKNGFIQPLGYVDQVYPSEISHIVTEPDLTQLRVGDRVRVEVPDTGDNSFLYCKLREVNFTVTVMTPIWDCNNEKFVSTEMCYVIPRDWIKEILPREITIDDLEVGMEVELKDKAHYVSVKHDSEMGSDSAAGKVCKIKKLYPLRDVKGSGNDWPNDAITVHGYPHGYRVSDIARIVSRPEEKKVANSVQEAVDEAYRTGESVLYGEQKKEKSGFEKAIDNHIKEQEDKLNAEMKSRDDEGLQKEPFDWDHVMTAVASTGIKVKENPFTHKHLNPNSSMLNAVLPLGGRYT